MTRAVRIARWALLAAGIALTVWLSVLTIRDATEPWTAMPALVTLIPAVVVLLRRDWHVVGWLLLLVAVFNAVEFAEGLPLLPAAWQGWVYTVVNVAFWAALACLVAVFPNGLRDQDGVPGHIDRTVVIVASLATAASAFTSEVQSAGWSGPSAPPVYDNPLGFGWLPVSLGGALGIVALLGFIVATITLVVRSRRATGAVRQQYRWVLLPFAVLAVGVPIALVITTLRGGEPGSEWSIAILGYTAIPICFGVAMMRYRLFDIDRIISRTLAYAMVVATLTIAYLGVILGVGALATAMSPSDVDLPIPVVATALVAIGFQPVRKRALRVADRLVFGKQRTPYEALAGIKDVELDDLLPRIAQLVTESTAARGAIVWLSTGTELEPAAVFPGRITAPGPIPLADGQIPLSPNVGEIFPMLHQGSPIGAITTLMDPGEELPADDVRLLKDLASHAATTINGVLEATPLPDGIVTFLMTDIEGSTRLWEEDPERMAAALHKHDELVQRLIREGGGVLVKWRGEGDSTFSVFTDPGEAVEAAMALQEAIQSQRWDLVRPISIRAALHTGEAELRERDYFGQTVNRCARIRSLVRGGQTLVSAATRELIRSVPLETLAFKDLGEHELRDFKEPEHIYEVIAQTGVGPTEPQQAVAI